MENSIWKRLWNCHKTEWINEWINKWMNDARTTLSGQEIYFFVFIQTVTVLEDGIISSADYPRILWNGGVVLQVNHDTMTQNTHTLLVPVRLQVLHTKICCIWKFSVRIKHTFYVLRFFFSLSFPLHPTPPPTKTCSGEVYSNKVLVSCKYEVID